MDIVNDEFNELEQKLTWNYSDSAELEDIPWGPHKIPVAIELQGINLSIEKNKDGYLYNRKGAGEEIGKLLMTGKGNFLLNPVEPFHKPAAVSTHLLVELSKPVVIEPRSSKKIFATYPLEIVALISQKGNIACVVDTISMTKLKYTLYGGIKDGLVCRYWKSEFFIDIPAVNPLEMGILQLELVNSTGRWIEVNKTVLSAHGMKIYYNTRLVSVSAEMKISNDVTAETNFVDKPIKPGMTKAFEQFSTRLLGHQGKTVMGEGY
ncbi:MAG: DUF432 domain-containing protein [Bacillota bacterium]|nr:DUF432 domain-containing protein [Bacillota bacterium]